MQYSIVILIDLSAVAVAGANLGVPLGGCNEKYLLPGPIAGRLTDLSRRDGHVVQCRQAPDERVLAGHGLSQ